MAGTIFIRITLLPLFWGGQINSRKQNLLDFEINSFREKVQSKMKSGDRSGGLLAKNEMNGFMRKYGIRNFFSVLAIFQVPFYLAYFLALRFMVFSPETQDFVSGAGFFWIKDLCEADPLFILPVLSGGLSFLTIRLNMKNAPALNSAPAIFKKFKVYMPFMPIFGAFLLSSFPAALNLYWATLAGINYVLFWVFQNPTFLKMIGIPKFYKGTKKAEKYELENRVFKKATFNEIKEKNEIKVFMNKPKKNKKK